MYHISTASRTRQNPKNTPQRNSQSLVTPALEAMNELFQHFKLLLNTLNRAAKLRKQIPRFLASKQKIQEIEQILIKPSIQLSSVQTPLAHRGLLTPGETANASEIAKVKEGIYDNRRTGIHRQPNAPKNS